MLKDRKLAMTPGNITDDTSQCIQEMYLATISNIINIISIYHWYIYVKLPTAHTIFVETFVIADIHTLSFFFNL